MSLSLLHQGWRERATCGGGLIVIGLVNNMPDGGLRVTEWQFRRLLSSVPENLTVHLRLFTLPGIARSRDAQLHVARHYDSIDELWTSDLDGLIVTGTEPRAVSLTDEPYWPTLTKLVDWAEAHTISTLWSCLAAHSAVYHLDGVGRQALPAKLSGVFECERLGRHPLLESLPPRWRVPHSRCNEIAEDQLVARGYRILSRSRAAGVDTFAKQDRALHVFLQGHPEYDGETLFREYRRDVRRFLTGERQSYPGMPQRYFAAKHSDELQAFRRRALEHRHIALLEEFPAAAMPEGSPAPWTDVAICFYANWLSHIANQKYSLQTPTIAPAHPAQYF